MRRRKLVDVVTGYLWAAIALLAVGFVVWNLDLRGLWCDPDSLVQGHALWHTLTALSGGAMYLYLRTHLTPREGASSESAAGQQ